MKKLILILMVGSLFFSCEKDSASTPSTPFYCNIYGRIYITDNLSHADYTFHNDNTPITIDMRVLYVSDIQDATSSGRWLLVASIQDADHVLYEKTNLATQGVADFNIKETSNALHLDCN